MNDSFLEDMDLIPTMQKATGTSNYGEKNITRRRSQPSPVQPCLEQDSLNALLTAQSSKYKTASASSKISHRRSNESKTGVSCDPRRSTDKDSKPEITKPTKTPERRIKQSETRLKPVENIVETEARKTKLETKERPRWSAGSTIENSRASDTSSKENSRPLDTSRESIDTKKREIHRVPTDDKEKFEVAMLRSVKEIVSTYTKNESAKILRAMQDLYLNSQANLIKLMIQQTDDIAISANTSNETPSRMNLLVDENNRLRNDIIMLKTRNEELKKALEENERIKQENNQLKLRCKDLLKDNARYKKSHS